MTDESAAPQFVVLQTVKVGVQTLGGTAFSQVHKRFHGLSINADGLKLKVMLVLLQD